MKSADHGDYAGDYGMVEKFNSAFEEPMINVPLVMKVPGVTSGQTTGELIEMTDLYATVMELAGIAPPHYHFSQSLLPALRGDEWTARDGVFAEAGFHDDETQATVHVPPENIYAKSIEIFAGDPRIRTRAMMVRTDTHKYTYCPGDCDELFDLRSDPDELHNIADEPGQQKTVDALREKLLRWMLDTGDVMPLEHDPRGWSS